MSTPTKKPVTKAAAKAPAKAIDADFSETAEHVKAVEKNGHMPLDAEVVAKSVTVAQPSLLPALTGASPELQERMNEVKDNLESVESFQLPRAKMTAAGIELVDGDEPILEVQGVIIHTKKTNTYYENTYNRDVVTPPTCYSLDGLTPVEGTNIQGYKKQNDTCKGCPKAEFGTNSMKSGKACRNLKPMYLLLSDEAIMPRQLTITPASLKAANQYLMDLTERGIAYRKVKTKIALYKDDPRDTYFKMRFSILNKLDEQTIKNVEFLRNQWLPVMNAQSVDSAEFQPEQGASAQPITDSQEY